MTAIESYFGVKKRMISRYDRAGRQWPITIVGVLGGVVTQVKTKKTDGYTAIQLAFGEKKLKNVSFSTKGHLKKAGIEMDQKGRVPAFFGEVKLEESEGVEEVKLGERILASGVFKVGDKVTVGGVSKGKGFAGGVKRHGFAGGPKTHGQSDRLRAPGSIGSGTDPGRVWPGLRMAGHMGQVRRQVKNLVMMKVDDDRNELWVSGSVPGGVGTILKLTKIGSLKEFHPILELGEGFSVKEASEEEAKVEQGLGWTEEEGVVKEGDVSTGVSQEKSRK